jgi:AcrR family transcriptional regulator
MSSKLSAVTRDPIDRLKAAAKRREKLDDERRQVIAELVEAAKAAKAQGTSVTAIAEAAGVSRQAVYDLLEGKYGQGVPRGRPRS